MSSKLLVAGTLDSSRIRHSLAEAANVAVADVKAIALGNHGDEMVPVTSIATIRRRSLDSYLTEDAITGGGKVVALKKSGSAIFAPAHAVVELIDHIRGAKTDSIPASVLLEGEFNIHDVVPGVPKKLGIKGVLRISSGRRAV